MRVQRREREIGKNCAGFCRHARLAMVYGWYWGTCVVLVFMVARKFVTDGWIDAENWSCLDILSFCDEKVYFFTGFFNIAFFRFDMDYMVSLDGLRKFQEAGIWLNIGVFNDVLSPLLLLIIVQVKSYINRNINMRLPNNDARFHRPIVQL